MPIESIQIEEVDNYEVTDEMLELSSGVEALGGIESSVASCSNSPPRC